MNKNQAESIIPPIFNKFIHKYNGKRFCDVLDTCPNTTLVISDTWTLVSSGNTSVNIDIDPLDEDYYVLVRDQDGVDILWFHTYFYKDNANDGRIVLSHNEDEYKLSFDEILLDDIFTLVLIV